MGPKILVWIDMESTGNDPREHVMLEIAVVLTDLRLQPLHPGLTMVVHAKESELDVMSQLVRAMHTESGLLERVRASANSAKQVETAVNEYLSDFGGIDLSADLDMAVRPRLAGNSVHANRRFLEVHMPRITQCLHYRNIDVSTLKEVAATYRPSVYQGRPTKKGSHRALDDILESIEEYRYFLGALCDVELS